MTVALTYTELKTPPILTTPYPNSLGGNTAQYESKMVGGKLKPKRKQSKRNKKQSKKNRKTRRRSCKK